MIAWRSFPVAGLVLLGTATVLSRTLPSAAPVPDDLRILEIGAPVVTMLSPPGPFPPSMGSEALPTSALAAAGWAMLCLSLPPRLLRPLLGRWSRLAALPGLAFALFTLFCFLIVPPASTPSALPAETQTWLIRQPLVRNSPQDLLSQLFALSLLLVLGAAVIALVALPIRRLRRRHTPAHRQHPLAPGRLRR
ncbi:MAG: hypothetical protein GYB53_16305 [Rhodobacteraceae bacterium]|nr:hypothetical protein [Paracoccaceae bacterium]MBR9823684.1 hypothetical protein [Paracoccaceae bacterium]